MVLRRWGCDTRKFGLSTELINQIFGILNMFSLFDLFVLLWRVVTEVRIYIYTSHPKFEQDREVMSRAGSIWDSTFLNILRPRVFW